MCVNGLMEWHGRDCLDSHLRCKCSEWHLINPKWQLYSALAIYLCVKIYRSAPAATPLFYYSWHEHRHLEETDTENINHVVFHVPSKKEMMLFQVRTFQTHRKWLSGNDYRLGLLFFHADMKPFRRRFLFFPVRSRGLFCHGSHWGRTRWNIHYLIDCTCFPSPNSHH